MTDRRSRTWESIERDRIARLMNQRARDAKLTATAWAVWSVISDQTLGYRRDRDRIAHAVISTATGIERKNVGRALASLVKADLIRYQPGAHSHRLLSEIVLCIPDETSALRTEDAGPQTSALRTEGGTQTSALRTHSDLSPEVLPTRSNHEGLSHEKTPVVTSASPLTSVGDEVCDEKRDAALDADPADEVVEAELVEDDQQVDPQHGDEKRARTSQPVTGPVLNGEPSDPQPGVDPGMDQAMAAFIGQHVARREPDAADRLIETLCGIAEAITPPDGRPPFLVPPAARQRLSTAARAELASGRPWQVVATAFGSWLAATGGSGREGSLSWRCGDATAALQRHSTVTMASPAKDLVALGVGVELAPAAPKKSSAASQADTDRARRMWRAEFADANNVELEEVMHLERTGQITNPYAA